MNVYDIITERIIERLKDAEEKNEKFHWQKPFCICDTALYGCNYEYRTPYSGINKLLTDREEYLTFTQLYALNQKNKDNQYHIRSGTKGTQIVYFDYVYKKDNDGNYETNADGEIVKKPVFKYYTVFPRTEIINKVGDNLPSRFPIKRYDHSDIEKMTAIELERFCNMTQCYCEKNGITLEVITDGHEAFYSPHENKIRVPMLNNFTSVYEYVSTVAHELAHSTGVLTGRIKASELVNIEAYSKEELVAEIASSMLIASHFRIPDDSGFENSISYIQNWRKVLEESDTKKLILAAAQYAQKSCDYIYDTKQRERYLEEIKSDASVFETVPFYLKYDHIFVREAMEQNPNVWNYLPDYCKQELAQELDVVTIDNAVDLDEER